MLAHSGPGFGDGRGANVQTQRLSAGDSFEGDLRRGFAAVIADRHRRPVERIDAIEAADERLHIEPESDRLLLAVEGIAMYAVFAYVETYFTRWAFRSSMSAAA